MKYGLNYVESVLCNSGIRYNELNKIIPVVACKMREEYYLDKVLFGDDSNE